MDKNKLKEGAQQWMSDWNSRNMETIMNLYADDVVLYSPAVIRRWNKPSGKLSGKEAVEKHFRKGIEEMPAMQFTFTSILYGVDSVVLFYERETGIQVADQVIFNEDGKVKEVRVFYQELND